MTKRHVALLVCGVLLGMVVRGRAERRSQTLIPQFENGAVTVWKTVLAPHEKLGLHRHEHGRVVVALKGGTLSIPQQKGVTRTLVMETGRAYWLAADPPGELHGDFNDSNKPLEMMIVELRGGEPPPRQ